MKFQEKEKLFSKFLAIWKAKLDKIPAILKYLSAYPEIIRNIDENFKPISIEELYTSQLEWISLVAQLDNPIETNFFKDFWVPVQKDGYDYFIDLSSASLPLFEANYFFFEPYLWYWFRPLLIGQIIVGFIKFSFFNLYLQQQGTTEGDYCTESCLNVTAPFISLKSNATSIPSRDVGSEQGTSLRIIFPES